VNGSIAPASVFGNGSRMECRWNFLLISSEQRGLLIKARAKTRAQVKSWWSWRENRESRPGVFRSLISHLCVLGWEALMGFVLES